MQCRQCGTEIAEKAIICYKCGTATAVPGVGLPGRAKRASRRGVPPWVWVLIALLAAAAVWWRVR